jgi:hypothetical protein
MRISPGMHLKIGVERIGLAGEQGLELAARGIRLQLAQGLFRFGDGGLIVLGFAQFQKRELIVEFLLDAADGFELILQRIALLHDLGGALRIVPEFGVFRLLVQLGEPGIRCIEVKDASSAARPTA